jgi:hypothetical protein
VPYRIDVAEKASLCIRVVYCASSVPIVISGGGDSPRVSPNVGSPRICTEVGSGLFKLFGFVAARLAGCGLLADDRFFAVKGRLRPVRRFAADRRLEAARFGTARFFARLEVTRRLTARVFFREERELATFFFRFAICYL